jgi:hypothetical protein
MNRHRINLTTAIAALAILAAGCVVPSGTNEAEVFVGGERVGVGYGRGAIDEAARTGDKVRVSGWATSYGPDANLNPARIKITLKDDGHNKIATTTAVAKLLRNDVIARFPLFTGSKPGFAAELNDPGGAATQVCATVDYNDVPYAIAPCKRIPAAPIATTTTTTTTTTSTTTTSTTVPAPSFTVTEVNPLGGNIAGGDVLVITGTGFSSVTQVRFGSTPAASFNIDSDTQITVVTPPWPAVEAVHVTVTDGIAISDVGTNTFFAFIVP